MWRTDTGAEAGNDERKERLKEQCWQGRVKLIGEAWDTGGESEETQTHACPRNRFWLKHADIQFGVSTRSR